MNEPDTIPIDPKTGYLPTYEGCVICGDKTINPHTLGIRFRVTEKGVETSFVPDPRQEGYKNIVHGGIASALLDETIGWACAYERKKYFMTVELTIKFLKPFPIGTPVTVTGRATKHSTRFSEGEGEITDANGTVYSKAFARYFIVSDPQTKLVNDYLTFHKDDIDILKE